MAVVLGIAGPSKGSFPSILQPQNSKTGRALQGAKWLFPPLPQVGCHEVSVKVAMYVLFISRGCRGKVPDGMPFHAV